VAPVVRIAVKNDCGEAAVLGCEVTNIPFVTENKILGGKCEENSSTIKAHLLL
jgi:hypothetical protein